MVAFFTIVAIVVDISLLRSDRRTNKTIADLSAAAGVPDLKTGPWPGVCAAYQYVLDNSREFSAFDPAGQTWSDAASTPTTFASNPCTSTTTSPYTTVCTPNAPTTWAKFHGVAASGRITVDIQSGFLLTDRPTDDGSSTQGGCDQIAVSVSERRPANFSGVIGAAPITTHIQSVARLNATPGSIKAAALLLLDRHGCDVLQTGGSNTRVIAKAVAATDPSSGSLTYYPGIIQADSRDDSGSCPQPIINGQSTSGGPSIMACSTNDNSNGCTNIGGSSPSQIGVYALGFSGTSAGDIPTPPGGTYGDTTAVASPQSGRKQVDLRYRQNISALDATAKQLLTASPSTKPPNCGAVDLTRHCTDGATQGPGTGTWLVESGSSECGSILNTVVIDQNIWLNCDFGVNNPTTFSAASSFVVITGQLSASDSFTITDPRAVFVGGKSTGNNRGVDLTNGSHLHINQGARADCSGRQSDEGAAPPPPTPVGSGAGPVATFVVGNGSFNASSGADAHICQTMVYLASGFDKVPTTDNTAPCPTTDNAALCAGYLGKLSIASGSTIDWSAPNQIRGRQPTANEIATNNKFEDLAFWTEAGGTGNSLNGGSSTILSGVFFLPNANPFSLSGNGSAPIVLDAQFVCMQLHISGGGTLVLTPNPFDSVPIVTYSFSLVR